MQLNRSIKTKLYPNARQKHLLHDYFNATRFLWNKLLEEIKSFQFGHYKKDESRPRIPSEFDLNKRITLLKKDHLFLQDYSDDVLKSVSVNLIKGFDGFYQKVDSLNSNQESLQRNRSIITMVRESGFGII